MLILYETNFAINLKWSFTLRWFKSELPLYLPHSFNYTIVVYFTLAHVLSNGS